MQDAAHSSHTQTACALPAGSALNVSESGFEVCCSMCIKKLARNRQPGPTSPMPKPLVTLRFDGHVVTCDDCASLQILGLRPGRGEAKGLRAVGFCNELQSTVPTPFGCTRFTPDVVRAVVLEPSTLNEPVPEKPWMPGVELL